MKRGKLIFFMLPILICQNACQFFTEEPTFNLIDFDYQQRLQVSISALEALPNDENKKKNYELARLAFKRIEPILAFIDSENYKALNQANLMVVEEEDATNIKFSEAFGFQVIEEVLLGNDHSQLASQVDRTLKRLKLIQKNVGFKIEKDHHLLWLIRDQILRTSLLGFTGFDSPDTTLVLKNADANYESLAKYFEFSEAKFSDKRLYQKWQDEIKASRTLFQTDFDRFDRYDFIKNRTQNQIKLWNETVIDWEVDFPFTLALTNNFTSIFSNSAFNSSYFSGYSKLGSSEELNDLGERLFNDSQLSKNGNLSCASCHHKHLAFTDGLKKSPNQKRNSPTLAYSSLQKSFFFDNREGSLEGQIITVVHNKSEFNFDFNQIEQTLFLDSSYKKAFEQIFSEKPKKENILRALVEYIRALNAFDSKFDRNINGEESSLNNSEISGFNLFMGKAKCGTCHFAPIFNGSVPPHFEETEMESLGVPQDKKIRALDSDLGRFDVFQTEQRKYFFKTPTLRNISKTAPYMHNGVFDTLEEVIDFYEKGGGKGLGLAIENQTLPSENLNLSKTDKEALLAFLNTLIDVKY